MSAREDREREGLDGGLAAAAAPGPALLLAALAALGLPPLLAVVMPRLPAAAGAYLPLLPLPLLEIEVALVFALLVMPAFATPARGEAGSLLTGLVRGIFLAILALPFALAARLVAPLPAGAILAGCALVASIGAGAVAARAAFGAAGLAAAVSAFVLPALVAFFGTEAELPLGWLSALSPFVAAGTAAAGGASWTLGLLPGIALLAATAFFRKPGPARDS